MKDDGPGGLIEFVDCAVDGTGRSSVKICDKSADGAKIRFRNCHFTNPWNVRHPKYYDLRVPILFEARRPELTKRNGGVEFIDCHVWDDYPRPVAALSPFQSELGLYDVTGRSLSIPRSNPPPGGPAAKEVDLQLILVKSAPTETRKPDADAE
ncbi:MAG: hypothetical protein U0903_19635 [Planctomycetales bacterium]